MMMYQHLGKAFNSWFSLKFEYNGKSEPKHNTIGQVYTWLNKQSKKELESPKFNFESTKLGIRLFGAIISLPFFLTHLVYW